MSIAKVHLKENLSSMAGKLILVGASGAIGAATLETALQLGLNVIPTYHSRPLPGGVRFKLETDSLDQFNIRPDDALVIFAAYSDQEWVRTHPLEARHLNITATSRLAHEAIRRKALVIFLSSEAVFGLSKDTGWTETSEPCPTTEYGRQKHEMEQILQSFGGNCIVRTGWNVSSRPSDKCVVRSTYESLLDGSARLAQDNVFSLTDVSDTARLLMQVVINRLTGIVHAASGIPTSRTAMADEIVANSAKRQHMRYERIQFSALALKEPKPACSWLKTTHEAYRGVPAFSLPPEIVAKKVNILDAALA